MSTPEAKLDNELCKAKATAKPAAPRMAIKDAVWIPKCDKAINAKADQHGRIENAGDKRHHCAVNFSVITKLY